MKYIYLSYLLENEVPVYGGSGSLNIKDIRSLRRGDPANAFSFIMENHWGTHIDCPVHFFDNGKKVSDYIANFWHFYKPQVLKITAKPGQIIGKQDLNVKINPETDLLLLKSGWGKFRDKDIYSFQNPGLDPIIGIWLRNEYPLIKAIGFDWISLSSYTNRELGREAHKAFLYPASEGKPILIIEDMLLPDDMQNLSQVWVVPIRIEGIDSAPCTVIGVIKNRTEREERTED